MRNGDFPVIVIGASAGALEPLKTLFAELPADLNAAIFVVLHVAASGKGFLPDILNKAGHLYAHHVRTSDSIRPGEVYIAPPNQHLVIEDHTALATSAPKENHARPAINPLFRSAALAYGSRVIGVILSGTLDDGTAGLWEIKRRGGTSIVQSPEDASYPQMPNSAIAHVDVDHIVPVSEMAKLLNLLCKSESAHEQRKD